MTSFTAHHSNLVSMFTEAVRKFGPRPFFGVRRNGTWRWYTFAEIAEQAAAFRGALATLGVTSGDRVAVISNNRLEWIVGCYATHSLGAVFVPMYENQLDKEWKYILTDCGATTCLVGSAAAEKRVRALQAELPALRNIIGFDDDGPNGFHQRLAAGAKTPTPPVIPSGDDIAEIIYTSGTTGNPKGVVLTHASLAANVQATQMVIPFSTDDRSVAFLPWAHVMGGNVELNTMMSLGASLAICESPEQLLEMLGEVKPTVLIAVPRIWNRIHAAVQKTVGTMPRPFQLLFRRAMAAATKERSGLQIGVIDRLALRIARRTIFAKIVAKFGGELKYAVSGAAALSREVAEFVDNLGITVFEGYGMTESSGVITANTPSGRRIGSVGKPIPGVAVALDHEAPGGNETEGEILVSGHCVMKGYYNRSDETKAALTETGALRTGDLGRIDADGFLFITGRVKELYKLENGKYIAPAPLEEQLTLSPFIAQAVVHGADRPYNIALIVPDMTALSEWAQHQGVPTDKTTLLQDPRTQKLLADELEKQSVDWKGYERVKRFLLLDEEFSTANDLLTPTLKLKRRNVLKRYADRMDSLYR